MNTSDQVQAVNKMQAYIEDHLLQSISMNDLARVAGYSPYYSAKLFKQLTGHSPFEYIRLLRLTASAKVLQHEKKRILDVALDFYFDSHEGYTRAFSKTFGISPKAYQQDKPPVKWFIPYPVGDNLHLFEKGRNEMEDNSSTTIFTQVIEKPARKLILKRGLKATEYFSYCEEVGCDVWGILCSVTDALSEPMGLWLPQTMIPQGSSSYVQGVEVPCDYDGPVPDGFDLIDLPPCHIMIFQGQPYDDAIFETAIGQLQKAIGTYDPTLYGFTWDPVGYRFQYEPQGQRGYIEGRCVLQCQ